VCATLIKSCRALHEEQKSFYVPTLVLSTPCSNLGHKAAAWLDLCNGLKIC
jgi:hypothetical protein